MKHCDVNMIMINTKNKMSFKPTNVLKHPNEYDKNTDKEELTT